MSTPSAKAGRAMLHLAEQLSGESKAAARKASEFEQAGMRNEAFRALGIAEGLSAATSRVIALARDL